MNNMWKSYPEIENDLNVIKKIMLKNVECREKNIEAALKDLVNSGGKMLRPAFLTLSSRFGEFNPEKIYPLGAVVEMLHMSTLIHDDIVDDAPLRRGDATIQSKYGKNYAVFMGDFLFTRCFALLSDKTSIENIKMVSKIISGICIGEIDQFSSKFNSDVSMTRYLKRIAAKTAALFSLSMYIGAAEGGCDKKFCKKMGKVGYNAGMAFQIIDDILDFSAEEIVVGKPVGNDLKEGIFTLPLIYSIENDDGSLSNILTKSEYKDSDIKEIINIVKSRGGIDKARTLAEKYTDKAFKFISTLPECENKYILTDIVRKLLIREY